MALTGMMIFFVSLINIGIPVALLCILQYFLSKMESPWPGRVLPILSGVSALGIDALLLFNMIGPMVGSGNPYHVAIYSRSSLVMLIVSLVLMWLPMVIYIVIYRRTRRSLVVKKNMERMSIQDLE